MTIMNAIRQRVRAWLGFPEMDKSLNAMADQVVKLEGNLSRHMEAGLDLSFDGNTRIVVLSKLGGGRCEIFNLNLKDPRELSELLVQLTYRPSVDFVDAPREFIAGLERTARRMKS